MNVLLAQADALHIPLADESVHVVVTSPPYFGLRDYGAPGQLGLERQPDCLGWATGNPCGECYVCRMVAVFREVRRVLRDDGTLWLNLGDSYNGSGGAGGDYNAGGLREGQPRYPGRRVLGLKPKDLIGVPWRVALALQADGWWLRSEIIWAKSNPMPESVTDRPTRGHEYVFLLTKSKRYYYDQDAIREPNRPSTLDRYRYPLIGNNLKLYYGQRQDVKRINPIIDRPGHKELLARRGRNARTVWTVATRSYSGAHFAVYPPALVEPCIKAGSSEHGCCARCGAPWKRADGGWRPVCSCGVEERQPCVVLDPFVGSGTTAMVARQLGRRGIGLDLNYTYLDQQARARLQLSAVTNRKNQKEKIHE